MICAPSNHLTQCINGNGLWSMPAHKHGRVRVGFMLKRLRSWVTKWIFFQPSNSWWWKNMKIMQHTTWRSSWCFRVPMGHHTRFGRDEQWLAPALGEARCFSPMKLFLKAQKVILSIYWKTTPPRGGKNIPYDNDKDLGIFFLPLDSNRVPHFVGSRAVEDSTWDLGSSSKCSITPGEDVGDSDRLIFFDVRQCILWRIEFQHNSVRTQICVQLVF